MEEENKNILTFKEPIKINDDEITHINKSRIHEMSYKLTENLFVIGEKTSVKAEFTSHIMYDDVLDKVMLVCTTYVNVYDYKSVKREIDNELLEELFRKIIVDDIFLFDHEEIAISINEAKEKMKETFLKENMQELIFLKNNIDCKFGSIGDDMVFGNIYIDKNNDSFNFIIQESIEKSSKNLSNEKSICIYLDEQRQLIFDYNDNLQTTVCDIERIGNLYYYRMKFAQNKTSMYVINRPNDEMGKLDFYHLKVKPKIDKSMQLSIISKDIRDNNSYAEIADVINNNKQFFNTKINILNYMLYKPI